MLPSVAGIFVSSTWIDLQPERHAVEEAINRMSSGKFIGMEYFGGRPETTERASLDKVDKRDLYVGIIGGRYGSGITEKEYRRARERNLPCFIYFKNESAIPTERHNLDWLTPPAIPLIDDTKTSGAERPSEQLPPPPPRPSWGIKLVGATVLAGLVTWFFWPEAKAAGRLSFTGQEVNKSSAPLTGRGIRRATGPIIQVEPRRLKFDRAESEGQGQRKSVIIKNVGDEALRIGQIGVTGPNVGDFQADLGCENTVVLPNNACELKIVFRPRGVRNNRISYRQATMLINHNAGGQTGVPLSGAATPPSLKYELRPNNLNFGRQPMQTVSRAQSITVRNTGETAFTIRKLSVGNGRIVRGALHAEIRGFFGITDNERASGRRLNPGDSCKISITFRPLFAGQSFGKLLMMLDDVFVEASFRGEGVVQERQGWRCVGKGQVAPATERECNLKQGRFFPTERQARANCHVIR